MDEPLDDVVGILWGARALQSVLPQIAGEDAEKIAPELDSLLARAASVDWNMPALGNSVDGIVELLASNELTRLWMRHFYEDELTERLPSYQPVPGYGRPLPPLDRYMCRHCGFSWFRRAIGQEVPPCPKDGIPLELDLKGE